MRLVGLSGFCSLWLLFALFHASAIQAYTPWEWRVVSVNGSPGPSTVFATRQEAEVVMRQRAGQVGNRLKLAGVSSADQSNVNYRYVAESLPATNPTTTPWVYSLKTYMGRSGGWHAGFGGNYSNEEELRAMIEAQWGIRVEPGCSPTVLVPLQEWVVGDGPAFPGPHEPTSQLSYRSFQVNGPPTISCGGFLQLVRVRDVSCPIGSWLLREEPPPYCQPVPGVVAVIRGRPIECPATGKSTRVGNPCDAATGDKHETEVDYDAAGLKFVRHYHSAALQGGSGLGAAWTHNFASSVASGYLRSDGYIDSFQAFSDPLSGGTISVARGSGQKMTLIGSESSVRSGDGSMDVYQGGYLLRRVDRAGLSTTVQYGQVPDPVTGRARISTITGPFGHRLEFNYTDDLLTSVTIPGGETINYAYEGQKLASVRYPDGRTKTYHYEDSRFPWYLTGITGEDGTRFATYEYDSVGRVLSSEHAGGAGRVSLDYQLTATQVTDALGAVSTYSFSEGSNNSLSRRLTGFSKNGLAESFTLSSDAQRRVTESTDARNNLTKYVYDNFHLTSRVEAFGTPRQRTTNYLYLSNQDDLITRETLLDAGGILVSEVQQTYNAQRLLWTRTVLGPNGLGGQVQRTTTYSYYANGQLASVDGSRSDVTDTTTYTYHNCTTGFACGRVNTITNAAGHVTTYNTYNAHGQPLTMTDPNGVVTTLTYDLRQRLTSRTIGTEVTAFEYWPTGLLKKATLPDASYLKYTYDAAHRLTEIEDSDGNRIVYTLDAMGNRTKEELFDPSSALTQTRSRVFDTLNRLQNDIGAAGTANVTTTFGYDNNGNQTSAAAPLGRNTSQGYDELNRLTQVTDPLSGVTHYGYNALDQLISVTDPKGLATSYSYNALGDLEQQTSPDTGVTVNTYDTGGNLKTSTDARNAIATYSYDALNRVTSAAFAVGATTDQTLTYSYDAGIYGKGRLTGASDSNHGLSWSYDEQGRLVTAGQTVGTVSKTTSYAYANGQRQSMTMPSGQLITYGYTNGKVSSISVNGTVVLSNVLYDPFGPARHWTWGNGTLSVRSFDQDGKITQIDSAGLKTYGYDDAFRITGITDTTNAALSWTYGYDDLDRLISASKTGTTLGYSYDANGNRLAQTGSGASTFTVAANSNRLTSTSGALARSYSYDNAGNTTSFTGVTFTYDNRGRMKSSTKNAVTTSYLYNALGQRVKKSGSSTTLFVYDDAGHLLGEYIAAGPLIQETVWLGDIPVATLRPKAGGGVDIFYIHTDHLNTPIKISRPSDNKLRWRRDPAPFGAGGVNQNPEGLGIFVYNLMFPGQYSDPESGLFYNYFRDYDPATGRYVQSDPIGLQGGINTYAYVHSNPLSYIDPLGLAEQCGCTKSYFDCLADCIRKHDPLNNLGKAGLSGAGGTFPKRWIGLPRGFGGASSLTTTPSAVAHGLGGGGAGTAGGLARGAGRLFSPVWIGYGLYLFGMEVYCATSCAADQCAH